MEKEGLSVVEVSEKRLQLLGCSEKLELLILDLQCYIKALVKWKRTGGGGWQESSISQSSCAVVCLQREILGGWGTA